MSVMTKLNLKDQSEILVLQAPESFESEIAALEGVVVRRAVKDLKEIHFVIAFVSKQKEVDSFADKIAKKTQGDAVIWFAYPKGTSKNYTCEFNRDTGWNKLGELGFEPVRQVAIDEDWSALRFRRVEFIKKLTRSETMALSAEGKARSAKKK